MQRIKYKQEIRGNPGDCYIACLLYVLKQKYRVDSTLDEQKGIFVKGILKSQLTFYMGTLNELVSRYNRPLQLYISNKQQADSALREALDDRVKVTCCNLNTSFVEELMVVNQYVTISVDRFVFYSYYHDYFFSAITKENSFYKAFEPYSGNVRSINKLNLDEYVYSTRRYLDDVAIAIVV